MAIPQEFGNEGDEDEVDAHFTAVVESRLTELLVRSLSL